LIAEHLAQATTGHATRKDPADLTIAELCSRYVSHAEHYYRKHNRFIFQIHTIRRVVKTLRSLYAHSLATDFGPLAMKTCRQGWIDEGLTGGGVNSLVRIVRAIVKWGAENEPLPVATWQALTTVAGLKRGRTSAPESDPVRPLPEDMLAKTHAAAHPKIRAMILVQLKSGMRMGELLQLRGTDLEVTGAVWIFRPLSHQLEHLDRGRVVFLGPAAQTLLKSWLRDDPAQFLIGPRQLREYDLRDRPAPRARTAWEKRHRRRRVLQDRYTPNGYLQAVHRACDRAKVARWSPGMLRHNASTVIRARFGIEATRTVLVNSHMSTTQIYAEADLEKADRIMTDVG
jgi:integrase